MEDAWGLLQEVKKLVSERPLDPTESVSYGCSSFVAAPYPLVEDGYALAVDPFEDPSRLVRLFHRYGMVVVSPVVTPRVLDSALDRIFEMLSDLSGGAFARDGEFDPDRFPRDASGTPVAHRGFFEVFHDDALAQLRQAPAFYAANALIWGRTDLWVTFDRLAVKSAGAAGAPALPWHVDQNPNIDPGFRTLQGLLALVDSPAEAGTFSVVPGSRDVFDIYQEPGLLVKDYVPLPEEEAFLHLREGGHPVPMRAGDLVLWDSRTTHANTTAAVPGHLRVAALMACGPAGGWKPEAAALRQKSFLSAQGWNDRDALLHASFKPRYQDPDVLRRVRKSEQLTPLGRLLYGLEEYPA